MAKIAMLKFEHRLKIKRSANMLNGDDILSKVACMIKATGLDG